MPSPSGSPSLWKSRRLLAVTGTFAAACAFSFVFFPSVLDYPHIVACAILGTASATWLLWGLILERRNRYGLIRGMTTGVLTGVFAHFFMWVLHGFSGLIVESFPAPVIFKEPLLHPKLLISAALLTPLSVGARRFGTVFAGVALGAACGHFGKRRLPATHDESHAIQEHA